MNIHKLIYNTEEITVKIGEAVQKKNKSHTLKNYELY